MINYTKRDSLKNNINNLERHTKIISMVRLILAITSIILVLCFLTLENYLLYLILTIISFVILFLVIFFTNSKYHDLKILKNLEDVYKKHDLRRSGSYTGFADDGREFIDYNDYKILDIDLIGPKSLYQYLCVAKTKYGRLNLTNQLKNPTPKSNSFRQSVLNIANDEESFLLEASLNNMNKELNNCDYDELLNVTSKNVPFKKVYWVIMSISYLLFFTLLVIFLINDINPLILLGFALINYFITSRLANNPVFNLNSSKYQELLDAYQIISKDIIDSKINDEYFNELREEIKKGYESIKLLKKVFDMLSYRKNIILSIIGNGIFFMDFFIILRFNQYCKKIDSIDTAISAIAEIELILSLATIGIDNDIYCIGNDGNELYIEDGYHPLVNNCVANSFVLAGGVVLTGSNMSGKTTFQRMIGINQTLFNAGGLVCAKYYSSKFLNIVTSLRANDMLQEGISTFYAEIKRMKKIVDTIKHDNNTLVLIDEIFKGTNAKDRIYGSLEIIKTLNNYNILFIITTHDFEICDADNVLNYHFSEDYIDDKISFDYKIKDGKCLSTNAKYLLKMSGIIE